MHIEISASKIYEMFVSKYRDKRSSIQYRGIKTFGAQKYQTRKLCQVFMYNSMCLAILIFPIYVLLTKIIDIFWSKCISTFWSLGISTFWPKKIDKKN